MEKENQLNVLDYEQEFHATGVWRNDYGVAIRKACFSCAKSDYSSEAKMHIRSCGEKGCLVKRTFCCDNWVAKKVYQSIGSGRTATGALARPGDVKRPEYIKFLSDLGASGMKYTVENMREMFAKKTGGMSIYCKM